MKPTPTEAPLALARSGKPLPVEEFNRLATHSRALSFEWRHIRHKLAVSRLAWAAEKLGAARAPELPLPRRPGPSATSLA